MFASVNKNRMTRTVLRPEIKTQLLASQKMLAAIGDEPDSFGKTKQVQSVARLIKTDSPKMLELPMLQFMVKLLDKTTIAELVMEEEVGDKELHHE